MAGEMGDFSVDYPFYYGEYNGVCGDVCFTEKTWIPGTRNEFMPPDTWFPVADGIGKMVLTVVSSHKPGRFPERVFYTRKWVSPDGLVFGNEKLHIATRQKFNRICKGFAYDFEIRGS